MCVKNNNKKEKYIAIKSKVISEIEMITLRTTKTSNATRKEVICIVQGKFQR